MRTGVTGRRAGTGGRSWPVAWRWLRALVGAAFLVSIIHYVDNTYNYAAYPQPGPGGPSAPSAETIGAAWFVFTAFGIVGLLLYRRRRFLGAAAALGVYSISGLIGLGHYTVPGAASMPWWRQLHVVADVGLGAAVALAAFRIARGAGPRSDR